MKNWKKYASLLLALVLCLSLTACGGETKEEVKVTLANQSGQDITSLSIAATTSDEWGCKLVDGIFQDGEMMEVTLGSYKPSELPGFNILAYGEAGNVLYNNNAEFTLHGGDYIVFQSPDDNPGITICTSDEYNELYAGYNGAGNEDPDAYTSDKLGQTADISDVTGRWYYKGDQDSEFATILTLNEDGTYTKGDAEEGTYTYKEYDESVGDTGTTVFRQEISLSGGFIGESYYLVSDGQVLVHWAGDGDNYYIHEDALDNEQLLAECVLTDESFSGSSYSLRFNREYTLQCDFFDGTTESRTGTWEMSGDTVIITWDDGETDEAQMNGKTLVLSSTGETLENPW